jgi:hypothetical protein
MFWTVSTTEMTAEQAEEAAPVIAERFPDVYADPVDPQAFFSLSLDRWTTELLRDALLSLASDGGDPNGLLEDVEDWLAHQAEPYPAEASPEDRYRPINDA